MAKALTDLAAAGVAVWLDDLSRTRIQSGSLARMVEQKEIVGITTNPTIFAKAIGSGSGYEDQLRDLALRGTAIGETLRMLTGWDVRAACDIMRPAYDASGGRDGRVSIEVDPRIAMDSARTAAEARGLWWLVDRPNLFIKIPATLAGLPAISETLAAGISVNVTLIFSVERYKAVLDAFLTGLEQRAAAGESLDGHRKRRLVLRQPRGHRGRQAPGRHEDPRPRPSCAVRPPWPTAASPTRSTSGCWVRPAGRRSPPRVPSRSACSGPPPASRTRPTPTPNTSSTWLLAIPSTPCRRRPCTPSPTMARCSGDTIRDSYAAAHTLMDDLRRSRRGPRRGGGPAGTAGRRIVRKELGGTDRLRHRTDQESRSDGAGRRRCQTRPWRPGRGSVGQQQRHGSGAFPAP